MMPLGFFWLGLMAAPEPVSTPAAEPAAPPVRIWINNSRQFREGEKARVQVETNDDGYLVVFHADPEGRLRVLFPLSPRDDNFVRGGRRYEIRGRGDDETFIASGDGEGLIYAAVAEDPIRWDDYDTGGNWDYGRLSLRDNSRDAEVDITDLLQRMVSDRGYDYDVLSYRVYGGYSGYPVTTASWYPRPYGYWDDYYCDYYFRPSLFGCRYTPGWYIGIGYNPYRYGYGYFGGFGWPFYRNRYYVGGGFRNRNWPVLYGRPRGYTIVRRNPGHEFGRPGRSWSGNLPNGRGDRGGRGRGAWDGRGRDNGGNRSPQPDRPRGRRSHGSDLEVPNIERDRGGAARPPVQFERPRQRELDGNDRGGAGRAVVPEARPNIEVRREDRPIVMPPARRSSDDAPRVERGGNGDGGARPAPREFDRPRSSPPPRVERSAPPPPRVERSAPPPRVERSSPPPSRSEGSRGGGGGSHGGRPRGNRS
jgi:hypothetical protein